MAHKWYHPTNFFDPTKPSPSREAVAGVLGNVGNWYNQALGGAGHRIQQIGDASVRTIDRVTTLPGQVIEGPVRDLTQPIGAGVGALGAGIGAGVQGAGEGAGGGLKWTGVGLGLAVAAVALVLFLAFAKGKGVRA